MRACRWKAGQGYRRRLMPTGKTGSPTPSSSIGSSPPAVSPCIVNRLSGQRIAGPAVNRTARQGCQCCQQPPVRANRRTHARSYCSSSPNSSRRRRRTRLLATYTAPELICSSAATSAAERSSIATRQNACHVRCSNSLRTNSSARRNNAPVSSTEAGGAEASSRSSGTSRKRC